MTPALMGIVNATPNSFSDAGELPDVAARVARARALAAAGARYLDVGGETASGLAPEVPAAEEIARVVPVIEAIATGLPEVVVSVDTHKVAVAEAAIAAGARLVNDVSGLRDPAMAELCAATGAGLVILHTRAAPKATLLDPEHYADVVADVRAFLAERVAIAVACGVPRSALMLDPGPDFAKTPAQTVAVLRHLDAVTALGLPVLAAVSRKDFLGAITGRGARERDAATLAAVGWMADAGASVLRVHDVAAAADYLAVRAVARGEAELAADAGLGPERFPTSTPAG